MIQKPRGIEYLPSLAFEISVTHKETLSSEGIVLNIDISVGHVIHERRLSNIWITSYDERFSVSVNLRKPAQMFSDFLQIVKRRFELLYEGAHSSKSSLFEGLTSV
jgi:hypothetical protein